MSIIAKILIALVALEHLYFLVLEMFLWTTPRTRAAFGMTAEQAEQTKVLAANQGLYNGFLAAGLDLVADRAFGLCAAQLALFFLGCVLVAGIYGGFTANKRIWLLQALPAAVALAGGHILVKALTLDSDHRSLEHTEARVWNVRARQPVVPEQGARTGDCS